MPNSSYAKLKKQGKCIKNCGRIAAAGHSICKPCRDDMSTDIGAERQSRRDQGLCPQCGEPTGGEPSCLRHMLNVSTEKGDDFVSAIMKSRGWKKRLSGGGTDSK